MSDFYDVGQEQKGIRDYRILLWELLEFLLLAAAAVFLFRSFLYEPFSIPGYSMGATLLPGDKILANKFIYGPMYPFIHKRIVHFKSPAQGEVVVYRDPAAGDNFAVKRIVGLPGNAIRIEGKQVFVNNVPFVFPITAERGSGFLVDGRFSPRDNMAEFKVPKAGDYLVLEHLGLFQFDFYASLIRQENPNARITHTTDLLINGSPVSNPELSDFRSDFRRKDGSLNFEAMDWINLQNVLNFITARNDSCHCEFRRTLYMDGMKLREYIVKENAYFLMGDNWDESMDSRFTGFVTRDRIEARASIIIWSKSEGDVHWRRLFLFL